MAGWRGTRRALLGVAAAASLGLLFPARGSAAPGDWPQFRGPKRDGVSTETGLMKQWPEGGPTLAWQASGLGVGYSSVSIVGDRLYTMGDLQEGGEPAQYVIALDLKSHQKAWTARVGPPHSDGSRCTPTVDEGRVYAIGTDGDLVCVAADSGKELWRKSFEGDFGGKMMSGWKFSESPLVDGDRLICTPGGRDAVMVALDKKTGNLIWKCAMPELGLKGKDGAGYSSIVVSQACGVRQYVQLTGRGVIGVRAQDGKFLWGYNRVANGVANITAPIADGDTVFASTGYGTGSALLKLSPAEGGVKAEEGYFLDANTFQNHHGGVVLLNGYLYAGQGHNRGEPICVEAKTGKVMWKNEPLGQGSAAVTYADGNVIFRYENGQVALVEATPEGFKLKGRFLPPRLPGMRGNAWAYPVVSDSKLYLRHGDVLLCYNLKG